MPDYSDYPFSVIADSMKKAIERGGTTYQKWSCGFCASRQTMDIPDTLYKSGRCEECGRVTQIERCNFMVILPLGVSPHRMKGG